MKRGKYFLTLAAVLCTLFALSLTAEAVGREPVDAVQLETIEVSGTVDLFQCGSLTGNYTKPGEVTLFSNQDKIEKEIYNQIHEGLAEQQEMITIVRKDLAITQENLDGFLQQVVETYEKVVNDNPRLFYVSEGYRASGRGDSVNGLQVILTPMYWATVTEDQIAAFNQAVEEAKDQVAGVTDDVEKLLILHDYLILKNAYNWVVATTGTTNDLLAWSAYAALVQGDPVCEGYSLAYKLLLNELDIKCITVSSDSMNHMWNMVQVNGSWYHVDISWDDPVPNSEGRCRHTYFLLSDKTIEDPGDHYGWEEGTPKCTSTAYESGWVFNTSNSSIYRWNGEFYYVSSGYDLYQTSALNDEGTQVAALANSYHTGYGIAWLNGYVYYVPYTSAEQQTLKACRLDSGEITAIGTFDFTATAAPPFTEYDDYIGLRYNTETDKIEAVSSTRRSVLFTVAALSDPLAAPSNPTWDGRYMTWTPPAETENVCQYEIQIFYGATEERKPEEIGGTWSFLNKAYLMNCWLQEYGDGYYYFRVRAISNDITVACSSEWTDLNGAYLRSEVSESVQDQLQSIVPNLTESGQIGQTVDKVKEIDTDRLSAAMAADKENSDTVAWIKQLEIVAKVAAGVSVTGNVSDAFQENDVSVVGAGLNAGEDGAVTLKIEEPTEGITIPELYSDALPFSMHLEGAEDADAETAGQQMAVPVKITLPIPANINPAFLVVLHHTDTWEEILPYVYCEDGQWYAAFVVTSFSDFAICEAVTAEKTNTGVTVTLELAVEQTDNAVCAVYDENGKQLGLACLSNLTSGEQTVEISCDAAKAATVKVFLLDADSTPLYEAAAVDLTV